MTSLIFDFLDHLKQQNYSVNSLHSHRLDVVKFEKWWEALDPVLPLGKISPQHLQQYWQFLETTLKPRTIARHVSSLKLFFSYLESQNIVKKNPMNWVEFPKIVYDPPQILSPEEVIALLEAPDLQHYLGMRDRAILELLYSSGLKVTELVQLNVQNLELEERVVHVGGSRNRAVPLTSKAVAVLKNYLESARQHRLLRKEDDCLFSSRNGVRMTRIGIWFMLKRHAKQRGIQTPLNGRILRHSFASHLLQNGMDLSDIQKLFGYVDLNATLQYAHINPPNYEQTFHEHHPRG